MPKEGFLCRHCGGKDKTKSAARLDSVQMETAPQSETNTSRGPSSPALDPEEGGASPPLSPPPSDGKSQGGKIPERLSLATLDACIAWGCPNATPVEVYDDEPATRLENAATDVGPPSAEECRQRTYLALTHDLVSQSPWLADETWRRVLYAHLVDMERLYEAAGQMSPTAADLELFRTRNAFFLYRIRADAPRVMLRHVSTQQRLVTCESTAGLTPGALLLRPSAVTMVVVGRILSDTQLETTTAVATADAKDEEWQVLPPARPFDFAPSGLAAPDEVLFENWPAGRLGRARYTMMPPPATETSVAAAAATAPLPVVFHAATLPATPGNDDVVLAQWLSNKQSPATPERRSVAFRLDWYDDRAYFARTAALQRLLRAELEQLLSSAEFFAPAWSSFSTLEELVHTGSPTGPCAPTTSPKRPSSAAFAAEERLLDWLQAVFARHRPAQWKSNPRAARDAAQCAAAHDRIFAKTRLFSPLHNRARFVCRLLVFHALRRLFVTAPDERKRLDACYGRIGSEAPHVEWHRAEQWATAVSDVLDFVLNAGGAATSELSDELRRAWNRRERQYLWLRALHFDYTRAQDESRAVYPPRPTYHSLWVCVGALRFYLYVFSGWSERFALLPWDELLEALYAFLIHPSQGRKAWAPSSLRPDVVRALAFVWARDGIPPTNLDHERDADARALDLLLQLRSQRRE